MYQVIHVHTSRAHVQLSFVYKNIPLPYQVIFIVHMINYTCVDNQSCQSVYSTFTCHGTFYTHVSYYTHYSCLTLHLCWQCVLLTPFCVCTCNTIMSSVLRNCYRYSIQHTYAYSWLTIMQILCLFHSHGMVGITQLCWVTLLFDMLPQAPFSITLLYCLQWHHLFTLTLARRIPSANSLCSMGGEIVLCHAASPCLYLSCMNMCCYPLSMFMCCPMTV